jgi:hypothetical protein
LIDTSVTIIKAGNLFDISDLALLSLSGFIVDDLLHVPFLCPLAYLTRSISTSHDVWHMCFGHPGPGTKTMQTMGLPTSMNGKKCEVCNFSKMTLQSFPGHFPEVHHPLQRIHMDLVGPINPPSILGYKYFLTIVDQYSSFKFIWFLKAKSQKLSEFKKFVALIENIKDLKIKEVVSDRGGEFTGAEFSDYMLAFCV